MLRAAHDAIKAVDPADNVLLGGISGVAGTAWLAQVFATPGPDAIHAFDVANLHERGDLSQLAPDVTGLRRFLAAQGFAGPLWITEHGYSSDPAYQYDPGYTGGAAAPAAYLAASIPTLVDAGAAEVFVTGRDNLSGEFASEGVLGGDVADPPPPDPDTVAKPALSVVQSIAGCFAQRGRDCPGAPATAFPSTAVLAPVPPGSPLTVQLSPVAFALPAVTRLAAAGRDTPRTGRCRAPGGWPRGATCSSCRPSTTTAPGPLVRWRCGWIPSGEIRLAIITRLIPSTPGDPS